MRRGARSSASASSDVVVISRLQIGHSLLRVVNHGVLPTNALATVTDVENDICGEGGRAYMHASWNSWPQGRVMTISPSTKSSKQTTHSRILTRLVLVPYPSVTPPAVLAAVPSSTATSCGWEGSPLVGSSSFSRVHILWGRDLTRDIGASSRLRWTRRRRMRRM